MDAEDKIEVPKAETMDKTIATVKNFSKLSIDDSAFINISQGIVQDAVSNTSTKIGSLTVIGRTYVKSNDENEMPQQRNIEECYKEDQLDILDVNIVPKDDSERSSSDDSVVSGMTMFTRKTDETAKSKSIKDVDTKREDIPLPSSYLQSCLTYIDDSLIVHLGEKNFVEATKLCLKAYDIIRYDEFIYDVDGDTESDQITIYQKCSKIFFFSKFLQFKGIIM